ncbi:MAG: hypothetical protein EBT19_02550 [Methylocystaceae bacterium]|jgi:hypothetical protein|nr:hypothetical protein [Methylocystaceae bacterium]NBV94281.1 hypothetical protein [Methylocystaceae bacterium]
MRVLLVFVAAVGLTTRVQAQQVTGGPIQQVEQCIAKLGPNTLAFTFYQPRKSRDQFCEEVPEVGPTIIVIDSMQDELRDMALELRVLKAAELDGAEKEQIVEAYLPPTIFRSGTIEYEHNFLERGNYVALIRARDQDGSKEYNATFGFSVGESSKREWVATSFLTVSALGGFWLWFRRRFGSASHDA